MDFDLTVLAALLAVIGYSLNDTVVVLDRIRETFRNVRKRTPVEILNLSINQTLSRTLMTSLTTLLVLSALFIFGGEVINAFAFALIIGVLIGTYSSIYVASSTLMAMKIHKQDFLVVAKEEVVDDRP
jgi:preprotein translocase subunit SecF